MREHWEILGTELHSFKEQLEKLLEMLPQSQKFYKQTTALNKDWKKVQRAANDMDQFITPVKSVKVVSPLLEDPEFPATWKLWKDYLVEQHGIHLRSRAELMSLKRLSDISGKQAKTAIRYLEFAMSRADKNFYKVNETDIPQPGNEKSSGKKVYKAPPRYSQGNNLERSAPSPPSGESSPPTGGQRGLVGIKQKTLQEEINEFKQSKKKKS
ncbi:MAG: hypothetical protein ACOCVA_00975 [Prolixibacteraceae bacterium]